MRPFAQRALILVTAAVLAVGTGTALGVDPNPLENAYWRFEEGPLDSLVPAGEDTVLDAVNEINMQRWAGPDGAPTDITAPMYTDDVPAPVIPQTGEPNTLALDFTPHPGGGDDIYTNTKNINNPLVDAITVEATFKMKYVGSIEGLDPFQGIVSKEAAGDETQLENLPVFVIKVRDTGLLQVEMFDGSGARREVTTSWTLAENQWYHAAAVNDGTTLRFYVDANDGAGYVLEGTVGGLTGGALWQGGVGVDTYDTSWTIGRAQYAGSPADWVEAVIDEVRITNRALVPAEFLFAAPVPNLRITSIERLAAAVRVLFENPGEPASAYGLAAADAPAGPFADEPAATVTDLGGGVIQADIPVDAGQDQRYFQGTATP